MILRSVMAAAMVTAALAGCGKEEAHPQAIPQVVKGVTVMDISAGTVPEVMEAVGTVKAENSAVIAARIPGTVTGVLVREGERVSKGKLLVTLMATETTAGAAGATAAVEEAKRGLDEALARKRLADTTFGRYERLLKEQAVTRQEFDSRQMEKEVADQGVERARARLVQAEEAARSSAAVAGYTRITAPLAGVVTGKTVDVGMTVFPGMPLMTVEQEGAYRLEVNAPASLLGKVKVGDRVDVVLPGMPETAGRVVEVIPSADPVSRTFPIKVAVNLAGVRSGLYGSAFFTVGEKQGVMLPSSAVMERGALTSVWVVDEGRIARMRLVKLGRRVGDRVEVLSGLSRGERVVIAGIEKVSDGARIE